MNTPKIITKDDLIDQEVRAERREERKEDLEKLEANTIYQNQYIGEMVNLFYDMGDQIAMIDRHIEITHSEMFKLNEKDAGNKEFFDKNRGKIELLEEQKSDIVHMFRKKIEEIKDEYIRDIRLSVTPQVADLPIIRALQDIDLDDNQLLGYMEQYRDNPAILSAIKGHLVKKEKLDLLNETDIKPIGADDKIKSVNLLCQHLSEAAEDEELYISRLINNDINKYLSTFSELG